MSPETSVQSILQRPQRIHTAGTREMSKRPLGQRLRGLVKSGVLSALLLAQALQIASATDLMFQGADAPSQKPVAAAMAHSQANQEMGIELVNPLDHHKLPDGVLTPNGINAIEFIQQWLDAQVEPEQLLELTQVLVLTQSPVLVRHQADKDQVLALSQRTAGMFEITSQADADAFLAKNSIQALEKEGLLLKGAELTNVRKFSHGDFEQTLQFWEDFSTIQINQDAAELWADTEQTPAQINQAIDALKTTMEVTGLNSLKVPLPMWTSADHLNEVASKLQRAEQELQNVTGWEGQVLGLKGQVNLTVGIPYDMAIADLNAQGKVNLQASMDMLAHEWIHGLDFSLAHSVGYQPTDGPPMLTEAVHNHHDHSHGELQHLSQTWQQLEQGVDQSTPVWRDRMANFPETDGVSSEYLTRASEKLAYAFDGMLNAKLDSSAALSRGDAHSRFVPTGEEASQIEAVWSQTFSSLKGSWWDGMPAVGHTAPATQLTQEATPEVVMPALKQWRQARQPDVEVAPAAPRASALSF